MQRSLSQLWQLHPQTAPGIDPILSNWIQLGHSKSDTSYGWTMNGQLFVPGRLCQLQWLEILLSGRQICTGSGHWKAGGGGSLGNSHCSDFPRHLLLCEFYSKCPSFCEWSSLWPDRPGTCQLQFAHGRPPAAGGAQFPAFPRPEFTIKNSRCHHLRHPGGVSLGSLALSMYCSPRDAHHHLPDAKAPQIYGWWVVTWPSGAVLVVPQPWTQRSGSGTASCGMRSTPWQCRRGLSAAMAGG